MTSGASRRSLLIGAGVVAAAAGAGVSWWRAGAAGAVSDRATAAGTDIWTMRFPRPDGSELVMAEQRGRVLVLNFWATWCAPCIKELPELGRFHRDQAGRVQVIALAVDRLAPVQEFLARTPLGFPVGLAGMAGIDLARDLGNRVGVLPFTVVFDRQGRAVQQRVGETTYVELTDWIRPL